MIDSERSFALKELAPLPWNIYKHHRRPHLYRLVDAQGLTVLFIPGKKGAGTGDRANEVAKYVLRVVNSHEELLEAAKLGRYWTLSHPMKPANSLAQIDEAINKATKVERGEA